MSGGGGKGGSDTQQIDPALTTAARVALDDAAAASKIGFMPNRGVQFAAFTPMQEAAMKNANEGATAYGMAGSAPLAGMPKKEDAGNGIMGYSTGKVYDKTLNKSVPKSMQAAIAKLFANDKGKMTKGRGPLRNDFYLDHPDIAAGGGK
jgi:hypothetical protein